MILVPRSICRCQNELDYTRHGMLLHRFRAQGYNIVAHKGKTLSDVTLDCCPSG
jgi:hypothetical protein